MWIVSMRMVSKKSRDEVDALSKEGFGKFKALPGLQQKHYIFNHETGEGGGIYFFDTKEAVDAYLNGPIVASVGERFDIDGDVKIEVVELLYNLND